jgi:gamma-glutamylcysteine synthetase
MSRNVPQPPTVLAAVLEIVGRQAAPDEDEALDDAIFLGELRYAVEGARTRAENLLHRYHPDWNDRLARICARYAD